MTPKYLSNDALIIAKQYGFKLWDIDNVIEPTSQNFIR